jgi:hypothetical protein
MEQSGTRWFSQVLADTKKRRKMLKWKNCAGKGVSGGSPSNNPFQIEGTEENHMP